ncbi:unnamed protein product [Schistocephalus solidus]|uniref:Uncharacterized protein n=1 Tax=Schistocephalus solidus TaxID=70667 RepID=A0A183SFZ1_SCHSO|nr:unnamed protein product [Schistocephalus solidus]
MITGVPKGCNNLQQQPNYVYSKVSSQGPSPTSAVFVRNPNCAPNSAIRRPTVRSLVLSEIFFPLEDVTASSSVLRSKSARPLAPDRRSCVVLASRDNREATAYDKDMVRNQHRRPSPPVRPQKCYSPILVAPKSSKATASQRSKPPPHPLICQSSFGAETARDRTPGSDSIFHRLQSFLGLGKTQKLRKEKLPQCAISFGTVLPSPPTSFPEISRPADFSALPQIRSRSQSAFRSRRSQKPLSDIFHSRKSHQVAAADATRQQPRRSDRKTNKLPPSFTPCDAPCLQSYPPPPPPRPPARTVTGDLLTPSASAVLVPLIYTPFTSQPPITVDCHPLHADPLHLSSFMPSNARPACRSRQHVGHQFRRRAVVTDCGGAGEVPNVPTVVACCVSDFSRCNAEVRQKHCSAHFVAEVRKAPSQTSSGRSTVVDSLMVPFVQIAAEYLCRCALARSFRLGMQDAPLSPVPHLTPARPPPHFVHARDECAPLRACMRATKCRRAHMYISDLHKNRHRQHLGPLSLLIARSLAHDQAILLAGLRQLPGRSDIRPTCLPVLPALVRVEPDTNAHAPSWPLFLLVPVCLEALEAGLWSASSSTSLGQPVGSTRRPTSAGQTRACGNSPGYSATPSPFDPLERCRLARVPVSFADAQSQTSSEDSAVELHHCMQRSQSVATQSECEGSCENGSCYSSPPRLEALSTFASPQSPLPSAPSEAAVTPTAGVPRSIDVDKTPTQESTVVSTTPPAAAEPPKIPAARSGSTATLTGRGRHTVPSPCEADPCLPLESPLCIPNERSDIEINAFSSNDPEEIKLPPALEAKSYHYNPMDLVQRRRRPQPHTQRQKSTNRDSLNFRNQCQHSPIFNDSTESAAIFRNSPYEDQVGRRSPLSADTTDGNWWADILPYKPSTIPDTLADRLRHCSNLALSRVDLNAADTRSLASSVSRTDLSRRSLMTRSLFEPRASSPGARRDSDNDDDGNDQPVVPIIITPAVAEAEILRSQPIRSQILCQRSARPRPVSYHDSCRSFTPAPMAQLPSLEHLSRRQRRLRKAPPPPPTDPCNIQEFLNFTAVAVPPPCESPLLTPYCRLRVLRGSPYPALVGLCDLMSNSNFRYMVCFDPELQLFWTRLRLTIAYASHSVFPPRNFRAAFIEHRLPGEGVGRTGRLFVNAYVFDVPPPSLHVPRQLWSCADSAQLDKFLVCARLAPVSAERGWL